MIHTRTPDPPSSSRCGSSRPSCFFPDLFRPAPASLQSIFPRFSCPSRRPSCPRFFPRFSYPVPDPDLIVPRLSYPVPDLSAPPSLVLLFSSLFLAALPVRAFPRVLLALHAHIVCRQGGGGRQWLVADPVVQQHVRGIWVLDAQEVLGDDRYLNMAKRSDQ